MSVYLDHAATTPMLPEAARVLAEQLARTGNPSSLHASGRAARRVVEESRERLAAALGARPERGRLDLGRHRGRQPRGQGPVLGPTHAGPAPPTPAGVRRRAPRRARPGLLDGRARRRRAGAAAGRRRRRARRRRAARGARAHGDAGRADLRDVGEQRGRRAAAARRRGRARPPVRRARARRRRAGRRAGAGRLRCVRARRDDASAGTRWAVPAVPVRCSRAAAST